MQPPVYIVSRNRVTSLRRLVAWLLEANTEKVVILDNASTYPPLLAYYETELPSEVELVKVGKNLGPWSFYEMGFYDAVGRDYVLTDSDVIPSEGCPKDLLAKMQEVLQRFPGRHKVGPSLRTDNLPMRIPYRDRIIKENAGFWMTRLDHDCFAAAIDTTFALWRHSARWQGPDPAVGIRLDFPYVFEHTPWYVWPLTDEERYYANRTLDPPISHIREFWKQEGVDLKES